MKKHCFVKLDKVLEIDLILRSPTGVRRYSISNNVCLGVLTACLIYYLKIVLVLVSSLRQEENNLLLRHGSILFFLHCLTKTKKTNKEL